MESENKKEIDYQKTSQPITHGKIDKSLDELITNEDKVKSQNYSQGKKKQQEASQEDTSGKQRDERSASQGKRKNNHKHDYRKSDADNQKCKVFVENLNYGTNWGKLKDFMKQAGLVERADIMKSMDGRSRGKGIVEFRHPEDAEKAVNQLHEKVLDGRKIFVKLHSSANDDTKEHQNYERENYGNKSDQYNNDFRGGLANQDNRRSNGNQYQDKYHQDEMRDYQNGQRQIRRSRSRDNYQRTNTSRGAEGRNSYSHRSGGTSGNRDEYQLSIQRKEDVVQGSQYSLSYREGRQIFVGNMPFSVTENQFKEAFNEFGTILEFELYKDERSQKSRGQGIILFEHHDQAQDAVKVMDQAKFNDRVVLVKEDDLKNYETDQYTVPRERVSGFNRAMHRQNGYQEKRKPSRERYDNYPQNHRDEKVYQRDVGRRDMRTDYRDDRGPPNTRDDRGLQDSYRDNYHSNNMRPRDIGYGGRHDNRNYQNDRKNQY